MMLNELETSSTIYTFQEMKLLHSLTKENEISKRFYTSVRLHPSPPFRLPS